MVAICPEGHMDFLGGNRYGKQRGAAHNDGDFLLSLDYMIHFPET